MRTTLKGTNLRIVISNGSNKFHLAPLAAEMARRGVLAKVIASGWPTPFTRWLGRCLAFMPPIRRFLDRSEDIPEYLQAICHISELIFQIGIRLRRFSEVWEERIDMPGFWLYARLASRVLSRVPPQIYHFRACYGLRSVERAKRLGAKTICDHSIAHPAVLQYMVDNQGAWPEEGIPRDALKSRFQRLMYDDIAAADFVLVNSDFVKQTCVFAGIADDRVHVVYLGVDDKFLNAVPEFDIEQLRARSGDMVLYAGGVQQRKGLTTLAEAALELPTLSCKLVGPIEPTLETQETISKWFGCGRVELAGTVSRYELSKCMCSAAVFVFPSYCEGSARVIFEAMACGCYIITTPNSGSIVENGVHGAVVPAGDPGALKKAITHALANREMVARIGWANAQLIRSTYRQAQYGDRVLAVYRKILQNG